MRRVQSSDAKARFSEILDGVERRQEEIDAAIENIKRLRKNMPRLTVEEILSARHEGHKY